MGENSFKKRRPVRSEASTQQSGSYVIGRNAVSELIKSGRDIDKIYIKRGERTGSITTIAAEAIARGIPLIEVEAQKLDRMAGSYPHQGVIASAAVKDYATVEDILALAEQRNENPLVIIADGIEDPQNLGALLRVAECTGAHGVIVPKRHAVGLTDAVGRSSAGAIEYVSVAKVTNLASAVDDLKSKGLWIFAAEAGGTPVYQTDMTCPAAVILGSEGRGVSRILREKSDFTVSIPMYGKINSMNVTSAGAVILTEAVRQRHIKMEKQNG